MFYVDVNSEDDFKLILDIENIISHQVINLTKEKYDIQIDYSSLKDGMGIATVVAENLAEKVLERAIYYCPKDTGYLASTGRAETIGEGKVQIIFDCEYAWYVHEQTWKEHKFPTCAKFLTRAIEEVEQLAGHGFA